MLPFTNSKIWLYPQPVDFRKQIDGLVMLLAGQLNQEPNSGQVFIFRSKRSDRIKLLFWERNGFWLLYKRLEKGRFKFPNNAASHFELSPDQLSWLLSGLDFLEQRLLPSVNVSRFY